ncbi:MAG: type II secretion system protein [Rickettsiales bacterium]
MNSLPRSARLAFSLVELSIVLVILGLLTGGILAGQSLIRAAELRSITTQINLYTTAAQTFRDKYFAIPGDMNNATAFWGTDNVGCPNGGGSTGTCNGDGNGQIGLIASGCEAQEFWRQLARAGLIEGSYTPLTASACYDLPVLGTNIPKTKLSNVGFGIAYTANIVSNAGGSFPSNFLYTGSYGNAFYIGGNNISGVNYLQMVPAFKVEEAWNIDTKMDDGRPDLGSVTSVLLGPYNSGCATSATPGSAAYNLSNTAGSQCSLVIKSGL